MKHRTNMVKAIILSIGDELLIGNTLNTNAYWLGNQLTELGIQVLLHWTIPDDKSIIQDYLKHSSELADIVLVTGGLGPTSDDLTIDSLSSFLKKPLVFHEEIWKDICSKYTSYNRSIHEPSKKMAFLPQGASPIHNYRGTAPGSIYYHEKSMIVSMPGVPYEMKDMMTETVIPLIRQKFNLSIIINTHLYTAGVGETILSDALVNFEKNLPPDFSLAYLPSIGKVRLRITGRGQKLEALKKTSEKLKKEAYHAIQKYVYSTENPSLEAVLGEILRENKLSLGTAESCTGGFLAHLITQIPGSSDYYKGTIVSYANEVKTNLLGVKSDTLVKYGAVSEQTVSEMLSGAISKLGVDIAIATSGVAGPGGGSSEKPVGCVYIGVANRNSQYIKRMQFTNDRTLNIELAANMGLVMLRIFLIKQGLIHQVSGL